jgi:Rrf2 family transcriptional regulator, cysteine metabolism repressor
MKLSTKARYGSRAMVELAVAYPAKAVPVRDLAASQRLPAKYLEQIMAALKTNGLVNSVRGARGGYTLAKAPEEISLTEVFHALEGDDIVVDCLAQPEGCGRAGWCATRQTWGEMRDAIERVLSSTTLRDLADRQKLLTQRQTYTYEI